MKNRTHVKFTKSTCSYKMGETGYVDGFFSNEGVTHVAIIVERPSTKPVKVSLGWFGEGEKMTKSTYVVAPLIHIEIVEDVE